jgi:uncharacterized protein YhaN
MRSAIRIIKRDPERNTNLSDSPLEKTVQQRERDMANTVKSWVAEWERRNRSLKAAASLVIQSLEDSSRSSSYPFAVVNR